jgi:aspartyl-tRNA(Asn)/glutamyl-tRNA(Gln) amidotransferase subunit B
MNSFKGVKDALVYEIERQSGILDSAGDIIQETRLWDPKESRTLSMRTKEGAKDYRYFPEPDLPTFNITAEKVSRVKQEIPELAREKAQRFTVEYGLSAYEARILVSSKRDSFFAEECLKNYAPKDKKAVANWLIGPLLCEAKSRNTEISALKITPKGLLELIGFVENGEISNLSAKAALSGMIETGKDAKVIIKENNLAQISDGASLNTIMEEVIAENPKSVADYKSGKLNALMFLVGQLMRKSKGKANPKVAQEILRERLDA